MLGLFALAVAAFAIGTTEFVIAGSTRTPADLATATFVELRHLRYVVAVAELWLSPIAVARLESVFEPCCNHLT
jgi:predicted MFS family arabinose efflux permease